MAEMVKRCPKSPAPVGLGETVVRGLYSPNLFKDGKVTHAAVRVDELISSSGVVDRCGESSGVSVFRVDFEGGVDQTADQLRRIVSRPTGSGEPRIAVGYAPLLVRELAEVEGGPLNVLDDGADGISCHAVVRAAGGRTPASLRGARDQIIKTMQGRVVRFE